MHCAKTAVVPHLMALGVMVMSASLVGAADAVPSAPANPATGTAAATGPRISGQGKMRFKVFLTSEKLPEEAKKALRGAHGGTAVDHRPGKGEIYFFLKGAGIVQVNAAMNSARMIPTADAMKNVNMHNTSIWYAPDGAAYLAFPGNDVGKIYTTDLEGKLLNTLSAPEPGTDLGNAVANDYFAKKSRFSPTGVDYLDGRYYVSTGYCALDQVLTAQLSYGPFNAIWHDLSFGGRGTGVGQFGTGHSIIAVTDKKRIDVADRANAEIERFTRYGQYLSTVKLPAGTLNCDMDYWGNYGLVPALDGPDRTKGAPIYVLENDQVVSTIMPKEELGLANFQHIHNAVFREMNGKLYIITQSWNPGDFAILEQVTD